MQGEEKPESSYEPFKIKEKIGEMMRYGRPLTMQFSRKNRDLADDLRASMLKMYHLAVEIEKKYYRKTTTQELDVELEWLRHLVRLAADNIYLNELDQYCKHQLKIHYYIRYMDDVIILAPDKETLRAWKAKIEAFLWDELALDLNSKTSIRPMRQGVEFVGLRIWPTHMKLRKSTVRRLKSEVRKFSERYAAGIYSREEFDRRIASVRGLLEHAESESLRWRLNEIYRAELSKAAENKTREGAEHEPFADHRELGACDGAAS